MEQYDRILLLQSYHSTLSINLIKGDISMGKDVSYNKLFKLLIDKGLRKTKFAQMVGISQTTLAKLSKGQYVSMDILVKICRTLNCSFDDIVQILPQDDSGTKL